MFGDVGGRDVARQAVAPNKSILMSVISVYKCQMQGLRTFFRRSSSSATVRKLGI